MPPGRGTPRMWIRGVFRYFPRLFSTRQVGIVQRWTDCPFPSTMLDGQAIPSLTIFLSDMPQNRITNGRG